MGHGIVLKVRQLLHSFWAKRPLFFLAVGLVASVSFEMWFPGSGWFLAITFCSLLAATAGLRTAAFAFIWLILNIANVHWHQQRQLAGELWISKQGQQWVEARLLEDSVGDAGRWSARAKLHGSELLSREVIWRGSGELAPAGTEFKAYGVFESFEPERNPGVPDGISRLRAEGLIGTFQASEMREKRWIGPLSAKLASFKAAFRESIVAGLDEESNATKVIRAVVLGERSPDSLGLVRDFRESGTLHVFTVSGLHVAMVGGLVWAFLRIIHFPRRWAIPLIIAAMFSYVWLTGNGSAAIRAACMGAVFLGAFALRRRTDLLNALGAVLILTLLWNPSMILLPGIQLSYGVVAAIGLGAFYARRCFDWLAEEDDLLPKSEQSWWQVKWLSFRQKLADTFSVSLAASVGSAPLSMAHFGILTPISILATVALVAEVFVLLATSLLSALIHPLSPEASVFLNRKNAWIANACAETAGAFAKLPGAWAVTGKPSRDTLVIYDLSYGSEAACFASAGGEAVLIDSGGKYSLKSEVSRSLNQFGIQPDSLILTHADAGHVTDPQLISEMFRIRQVVLGPDKTRNSSAAAWEDAEEIGIRVTKPNTGSLFDFGNTAHAEILLSPHDTPIGSIADDRCLIFMLHWQGWKILWLSDAGRLSEQALLDHYRNLKADVVVAGFHETDFSLTPPFLKQLAPQAVIVPRLPGSRIDDCRLSQLTQWQQSNAFKVINRQQTGGLTLTLSEKGELIIKGFLDDSETRLPRRGPDPSD